MSNNQKKRFFSAAVRILALMMVVVMLGGCGDKKEKEEEGKKTDPIEAFWTGMVTADADKVMSAFTKEMQDDALGEMDEEEFEDYLEDTEEELEMYLGDKLKVSVEVKDEEKLDEEDLADLREELVEEFDIDGDKVSEAWVIEAEVTVEGSKDEYSEIYEYVVFQYKGKWYMDPLNSEME